MTGKPFFVVILFLHNAATAFWVGGMLTLSLTVIPAIKRSLGLGPQAKKLMDMIQDRLSRFTYVNFVLLAATGLLLSRHSGAFHGLFRFDSPAMTVLSVKHILVIAMIVIAIVRSRFLASGAVPTGGKPNVGQEKLKAALLFTNVLLGLLVLFLSSLFTAMTG